MICIIDCGTSWLTEIKDNVKKSNQPFEVVKLSDIPKTDFHKFSGVIISGAPIILTQNNQQKYINLFSFVKTVNIPILGICLGHQLIGLVYGSELKAGQTIEKMEQIEIIEADNLFQGIANQSLFREEHSEHLALPKDFILLAKSPSCSNEAMNHQDKEIYGVQFHPEVSGDSGTKLFENFLKLCQ